MTATRDLATHAAVIKYLTDIIKAEEAATKNSLKEVMDPGDRKTALAPDGSDIGTITYARVTETEELATVDEDALIAWCKKNGHADGIRTFEAVADWKRGDLFAIARDTGELPDGMEYVTRKSGGYVSVRKQTPEQVANLLANVPTIAAALERVVKEIQP